MSILDEGCLCMRVDVCQHYGLDVILERCRLYWYHDFYTSNLLVKEEVGHPCSKTRLVRSLISHVLLFGCDAQSYEGAMTAPQPAPAFYEADVVFKSR